MIFGLSKLQLGATVALAVALVGATWYSTRLLRELGEAEAQQAVLRGDLEASNAAAGVLAGELAERDALAAARDADRRRLWADNARLRAQLTEEVANEPDPVLQDCARAPPPAGVRRILQQHHAAAPAH